jgi:hypothetical protein
VGWELLHYLLLFLLDQDADALPRKEVSSEGTQSFPIGLSACEKEYFCHLTLHPCVSSLALAFGQVHTGCPSCGSLLALGQQAITCSCISYVAPSHCSQHFYPPALPHKCQCIQWARMPKQQGSLTCLIEPEVIIKYSYSLRISLTLLRAPIPDLPHFGVGDSR